MKKVVALFLIVCLTVTMFGCKKADTDTNGTPDSTPLGKNEKTDKPIKI